MMPAAAIAVFAGVAAAGPADISWVAARNGAADLTPTTRRYCAAAAEFAAAAAEGSSRASATAEDSSATGFAAAAAEPAPAAAETTSTPASAAGRSAASAASAAPSAATGTAASTTAAGCCSTSPASAAAFLRSGRRKCESKGEDCRCHGTCESHHLASPDAAFRQQAPAAAVINTAASIAACSSGIQLVVCSQSPNHELSSEPRVPSALARRTHDATRPMARSPRHVGGMSIRHNGQIAARARQSVMTFLRIVVPPILRRDVD
jgi:hypothetical protein